MEFLWGLSFSSVVHLIANRVPLINSERKETLPAITIDKSAARRVVPRRPFCSQLPSANKTQSETEMLCCPSSACTKRADCKPNTLSAGGVGGSGAQHMHAHPCMHACTSSLPGVVSYLCAAQHPIWISHAHTQIQRFGFGCASSLMPSLLYRLRPGPAGPGPKVLTLYIFNDLAGVFFHATVGAL